MQIPDTLEGTVREELAFSDFLQKVIADAEPMGQNTSADNLGFGWIYYGLIRNLRPDFVVAIGSRRGFMPFCAARAVQDNRVGKVIFIDPSYSNWGARPSGAIRLRLRSGSRASPSPGGSPILR